MTDEMLRKVIVFSALIVAFEEAEVPMKDLFTDDEVDAFLPIIEKADDAISVEEQVALVKTMLREHLADILATTEVIA
jgi:hypothetical protein